jgi:predicted MFS family arabinose efflux permease
VIGAAFGLGFVLGPAISAVLAPISYTAPIWAAAAITAVALALAWFWLPETVHSAQAAIGAPFRSLAAMMQRPALRRILIIDFWYWFAFAVFQTTFALFVARRFGFDASQTGYFFAGFGLLGVLVQTTLIRPTVGRLGDKGTLMLGLCFGAAGLLAVTLTYSPTLFAVALVPVALGIGLGHPTISSLVSRAAARTEQGRMQGAAGAVESLGRTIGPVWGAAALQRFGDAMPYLSAAALLVVTLILTLDYRLGPSDLGSGE